MRIQRPPEDDAAVPLSPLIDCVFLLLIFFLVTTMLKRWEMQIPVDLPDVSSSLSAEARDEALLIALDAEGKAYRDSGRRTDLGAIIYEPVGRLAPFLKELATQRDPTLPLRLVADRETDFQVVIRALDVCQIQGFRRVEAATSPVRRKDAQLR